MQVWCRVTLHSNAKVTDARARNLQTYLWSVVGSVPAVLWRSRAHAQRRRQQLQQLQQPAGRMDALGSASSHCRDAWPEEEGGATSDEAVIHFWSFQMFGGRKRKLEEQLFSHTSRSLETIWGILAALHAFPGIMMLRERHPPPTSTTDQNLIYVLSGNISLHPITATFTQSPLRMPGDCPLSPSLDAFIRFQSV